LDDDNHEMQIPFYRMSNRWYHKELNLNSAHFNAGSLRIFGKWGDGVELKSIKLVKIPAPIVILKGSWWLFIAFGMLFGLIDSRLLIKRLHKWLIKSQLQLKRHSVIISAAIILVYLLCAMSFFSYSCLIQNRILSGTLLYYYCVAPFVIILFLLYIGWPLAVLITPHMHQRKNELLIAPLLGVIIIAVTHTLSLLGIPIYLCLLLLICIATPIWILLLIKKRYPVIPDFRGCILICIGIFIFWFSISPLITQNDVTGFTINNGDLYIYTTETQWLLENTMADAVAGTEEL